MRRWLQRPGLRAGVCWSGWALALLVGTQLRGPYLARVRGPALVALVLLGLLLVARGVRRLRRGMRGRQVVSPLVAGVLLAVLPAGIELQHLAVRGSVLASPVEDLRRYSSHFVLGYRSFDDIRSVIERMPLGGVYLTARNVRGRSVRAVQAEIEALRRLHRERWACDLLVMADQEGGRVSRLSPPLPARPNLGRVLAAAPAGNWRQAVEDYARSVAGDLSLLGVDCNLSPVVDLDLPEERGLIDLHTRLSERATSHDPERTARAARLYASTLRRHGVLAVAKHFPGLGRVAEDTHHFTGHLRPGRRLLAEKDWHPFEVLARARAAAVMVGHVVVDAVDPDRIASASPAVVRGVLRGELGHRGLVLTDDLCMAPAFYADGGIGATAASALAASVDLLLVTYDPDMFWPAMHHLLQHSGAIPDADLDASNHRLARTRRELGRR